MVLASVEKHEGLDGIARVGPERVSRGTGGKSFLEPVSTTTVL
jgi:hypothetical protein